MKPNRKQLFDRYVLAREKLTVAATRYEKARLKVDEAYAALAEAHGLSEAVKWPDFGAKGNYYG